MGKMNTAERVSREMSDNFVFQRSLLAYHAAAQRIGGDVLEIGTGAGYGIEVVAPHARSFITVDKFAPAAELMRHPHVEFHQAVVPPLAFAANSFDFVISFQVIEHVKQDIELVREVKRVLKPGGKFIVTTPNAPMSLTRNPHRQLNRKACLMISCRHGVAISNFNSSIVRYSRRLGSCLTLSAKSNSFVGLIVIIPSL